MSYQVLARKWRPRSFAEVIGQGHVLKALINALDGDRLHHAYLFSGTRGVGKTTLARVFAKALNCEQGVSSTPCGTCSSCEEIDGGRFVDLIEVDAASRTKVEETRDLLDNVQYAPTRARFKVYLIDEVHMFSNHSFNALLKTLEEPPPHVKFILATTDPKKLPVTILSRCLQFNLTRLSASQLSAHLGKVLTAEGIDYEDRALELIAPAAAGSVRDALSLLDQAIAHGGGQINSEEVALMLGTVDQDRVLKLLDALALGDGHLLIERARELSAYVPDYAQVLAELLSLLRRVAVVHALAGDVSEIETDARVAELATRIAADECQLYYQIALNGRRDLQYSPDPESGFEMNLLRMLAFQPAQVPQLLEAAPIPLPAKVAVPRKSAPRLAGAAPMSPPTPPPPAPDRAPIDSADNSPSPPAADAPNATAISAAPQASPPVAPAGPARLPETAAAPPEQTSATSTPAPMDAAAVGAAFDWNQLIDELDIVGLPRELGRNSALVGSDGRVFELVIAPQFEKLAQRRHIESLRSALAKHRGTEIIINLRIEATAGLMTPSEQRSADEAQRQREAEAVIENDPNVQALRETFGATIEDVSTR